MYRGSLSWRRLRVLIQHLPPESATWTALRNATPDEVLAEQADSGEPEKDRWSKVEQLLAAAVDRIARVEYVLVCANTDKKARRPDPPEPIRRPGARPPRPKATLTDEGADFLFNLINGGAA
ncbi:MULTISPECIES: hypothetical protein [unclassified Streptomyces]|uniref:hypothetical protein n=1 Tax=unclassified Streptomyces TaxID=2593676 RepID=UPI00214CF24F|nr:MULTISPECIES: hypothetical protein [unclassified Streptomyces]